jgi:hypothetical protein
MNKPNRSPHAVYVRGVLTLDLPTARDPVLWRQEIKNISTIIFSIHPLDNHDYGLILRVADGADQIIATFDNPDDADQALDTLRKILLKARKNFILLYIIKWLLILILLGLTIRLGFLLGIIHSQQNPMTAIEQTMKPSVLPAPPAPQPAQTNSAPQDTPSVTPPAVVQPAPTQSNVENQPAPEAK